MVRPPRTQRALLAALAVVLVVSAAAFVATASAQLAWQQRDSIDFQPTDYELVDDDDPRLRVSLEVTNPTSVDAQFRVGSVVVYDGDPAEGAALSVPRSERLADGREATVAAGATATVTLVASVPGDTVEAARAAIESDRAVTSGTFAVTLRERSYEANV
ncbi:hypothetical protein ACFQFH_05095 [Halobaculum halobium]|uniref:Late embryogenesis abundant protein LEA-2 subgroup domain-containing protein n=1 Tax=Halobaculum halobium TaxID=3032281 RepID=A0ABD5TD22_9EURY|nr:hypothetical protein [Halobaculum sp. SYNS20]